MPESDNQQPDELSKSQRKRDMIELQKLGERLSRLSDSQLEKLPLSEKLLTALVTARKLKVHEAIRRHMQYIGKIMRDEDVEAILLAMRKNKLT
jgi:ribosome-associated protein